MFLLDLVQFLRTLPSLETFFPILGLFLDQVGDETGHAFTDLTVVPDQF